MRICRIDGRIGPICPGAGLGLASIASAHSKIGSVTMGWLVALVHGLVVNTMNVPRSGASNYLYQGY
jgi:hypothetical protein